MRVAAMAFVLVVGAAVVLVFANTLNSWVLGGLLGGLAAILLSIPISLVLFTFLARRHDARHYSTRGERARAADRSHPVRGDQPWAAPHARCAAAGITGAACDRGIGTGPGRGRRGHGLARRPHGDRRDAARPQLHSAGDGAALRQTVPAAPGLDSRRTL